MYLVRYTEHNQNEGLQDTVINHEMSLVNLGAT